MCNLTICCIGLKRVVNNTRRYNESSRVELCNFAMGTIWIRNIWLLPHHTKSRVGSERQSRFHTRGSVRHEGHAHEDQQAGHVARSNIKRFHSLYGRFRSIDATWIIFGYDMILYTEWGWAALC
jgi:hypothetical protein